MLCWRTSFLITSACVRGSGQWSRATNASKKFAKVRRIHSMPGSLCAAGGWRGCWRPLWASQRMSSWKNRGQYSNRVASWIFSIFFVFFNNSQPLASLLGRQNTCFFELWCRRDAFFENRNRYGSIPVAMSKKSGHRLSLFDIEIAMARCLEQSIFRFCIPYTTFATSKSHFCIPYNTFASQG